MPTYQYKCTNADCGNRFELVQSFTDAPASECPVCSEPVRKVYSSVGVVFKGSGFYRTDSRAESKSGADSSSAKSESKSESSAKSDSGSSKSDGGSSSSSSGSSSSGSSSSGSSSSGSSAAKSSAPAGKSA